MSWYKNILPQNIISNLTEKIKRSIHGDASRLKGTLSEKDKEDIGAIMESGTAPRAWFEEVNRHIIEAGYPPEYGSEWAKGLLESGRAPEEWKEAISRRIVEKGSVYMWAEKWVDGILRSGKAPPEWIDIIEKKMISGTDIPYWSKVYIQKNMEEGWPRNSKKWMSFLGKAISEKNRNDFPNWGYMIYEYYSNNNISLEKEELKNLFGPDDLDVILRKMHASGDPDVILDPWLRYQLDGGEYRELIMDKLTHDYIMNDTVPLIDSVLKLIKDGKAPKVWYDAFSSYIARHGIPRGSRHGGRIDEIDEWSSNMVRDGRAPQEWLVSIHRYIVANPDMIMLYKTLMAYISKESKKGAKHIRNIFPNFDKSKFYYIRLRDVIDYKTGQKEDGKP